MLLSRILDTFRIAKLTQQELYRNIHNIGNIGKPLQQKLYQKRFLEHCYLAQLVDLSQVKHRAILLFLLRMAQRTA